MNENPTTPHVQIILDSTDDGREQQSWTTTTFLFVAVVEEALEDTAINQGIGSGGRRLRPMIEPVHEVLSVCNHDISARNGLWILSLATAWPDLWRWNKDTWAVLSFWLAVWNKCPSSKSPCAATLSREPNTHFQWSFTHHSTEASDVSQC